MELYKLVTSLEERSSRPNSRSGSATPSVVSTTVSATTPQSTPGRRFIAPGFETRRTAIPTSRNTLPFSSAQDSENGHTNLVNAARDDHFSTRRADGGFPSSNLGVAEGGYAQRKRPIIHAEGQKSHQTVVNDESLSATSSFVVRELNFSSADQRHSSFSGLQTHDEASSTVLLDATDEEKEAAIRYAEELVKKYTSYTFSSSAVSKRLDEHERELQRRQSQKDTLTEERLDSHNHAKGVEEDTTTNGAMIGSGSRSAHTGTAAAVPTSSAESLSYEQQLQAEMERQRIAQQHRDHQLREQHFDTTRQQQQQHQQEYLQHNVTSVNTSTVSITSHLQRRAAAVRPVDTDDVSSLGQQQQQRKTVHFATKSNSTDNNNNNVDFNSERDGGINSSVIFGHSGVSPRTVDRRQYPSQFASNATPPRVPIPPVEDFLISPAASSSSFPHSRGTSSPLHNRTAKASNAAVAGPSVDAALILEKKSRDIPHHSSPSALFVSQEVSHLRQLLSEKVNRGLRAAFEAFASYVPSDPILCQLLDTSMPSSSTNNINNNTNTFVEEEGGIHLPPAATSGDLSPKAPKEGNEEEPRYGVTSNSSSPPSSSPLFVTTPVSSVTNNASKPPPHKYMYVQRETAWRRVGEAVAEHMQSSLSLGYDALASELAIARAEISRQESAVREMRSTQQSKINDLEIELRNALEMNVLLMEEASQANVLRRQIETSSFEFLRTQQSQMNRLIDGETSSRWFNVMEEAKSFLRIVQEHHVLRGAIVDTEVRSELQEQFHTRLEFLKAMQEQWAAGKVEEEDKYEENTTQQSAPSSRQKPPKVPIRGLRELGNGDDEHDESAEETEEEKLHIPRPPAGASPRRLRSLGSTHTSDKVIFEHQIDQLVAEESRERAELEAFAADFRLETVMSVASFTTSLFMNQKKALTSFHSHSDTNKLNVSSSFLDDGGLSPLSDRPPRMINTEEDEETKKSENILTAVKMLEGALEEERQKRRAAEDFAAEFEGDSRTLRTSIAFLLEDSLANVVIDESAAREVLEETLLHDCLRSFGHEGLSKLFTETMNNVKIADQTLNDSVAAAFQEEIRRDFFEQQQTAISTLDEFWSAELAAVNAAARSKMLDVFVFEEELARRRFESFAMGSIETLMESMSLFFVEAKSHEQSISDLITHHGVELAIAESEHRRSAIAEKKKHSETLARHQREILLEVVEPESERRNELLGHFATQRIGILAEFFETGCSIQNRADVEKATIELSNVLHRRFAEEKARDADEAEAVLRQQEDLLEEKFKIQVQELVNALEEEKQKQMEIAVSKMRSESFEFAASSVTSLTSKYLGSAMSDVLQYTSQINSEGLQLVNNIKSVEISKLRSEHLYIIREMKMSMAEELADKVKQAEQVAEERHRTIYDTTAKEMAQRYEERILQQREELLAERLVETDEDAVNLNLEKERLSDPKEAGEVSVVRSVMATPVKKKLHLLEVQRETLSMIVSSTVLAAASDILKSYCDQHSLAVEGEFQRARLELLVRRAAEDTESREQYEVELAEALTRSEEREEMANNKCSSLQESLRALQEQHDALLNALSLLDDKTVDLDMERTMETEIAVQTIEALRSDYEESLSAFEKAKRDHFFDIADAEVIKCERAMRALLVTWESDEWNLLNSVCDELVAEFRSSLRSSETRRISEKAEETERLISSVVSNIIDSNTNLTNLLRENRSYDEAVVRANISKSVFESLAAATLVPTAANLEAISGEGKEGESDDKTNGSVLSVNLANSVAQLVAKRFADLLTNNTVANQIDETSISGGTRPTAFSVASLSTLLTKLENLEKLIIEGKGQKKLMILNSEEEEEEEEEDFSVMSQEEKDARHAIMTSEVFVRQPAGIAHTQQVDALRAELSLVGISVESSLVLISSMVSVLIPTSNESKMIKQDRARSEDRYLEDEEDVADQKQATHSSESSSSPQQPLLPHERLFQATQQLFRALHHGHTIDNEAHHKSNESRHFVLEGQLIAVKNEANRLRSQLNNLRESTQKQLTIVALSAQSHIDEEFEKLRSQWDSRLQRDIDALKALADRCLAVSSVSDVTFPSSFETPLGERAADWMRKIATNFARTTQANACVYEEALDTLRLELAFEKTEAEKALNSLRTETQQISQWHSESINALKTDIAVSEERVASLQSSLADANSRYELLFRESSSERSEKSSQIDSLISEKMVDKARIALLETDLKHFKNASEKSTSERETYWREQVDRLNEAIATEKSTVEGLKEKLELATLHEHTIDSLNASLKISIESLTLKIDEIEERLGREKAEAVANLKLVHENERESSEKIFSEKVSKLLERLEEAKSMHQALAAELSKEKTVHSSTVASLRSDHCAELVQLRDAHKKTIEDTVSQIKIENEKRIQDLKQQLQKVTEAGETQVASLRSQLAKTSAELESLRESYRSLSETHAVLKEGASTKIKLGEEALSSQVSKLNETISEYRSKTDSLENEIRRLREQLSDSERNCSSAEVNCKELAAKLEAAIRERDLSHEQFSRIEAQHSALSAEISKTRRQLHEVEMELTESKALLNTSQTHAAIAISERQEMHASKLNLERQLLEIHAAKHSDLAALQFKISSLSRRVMDEERRNGDLHRRCVEKDASLKRFASATTTTNVSNSVAAVSSSSVVVSHSSNMASIQHRHEQQQRSFASRDAGVPASLNPSTTSARQVSYPTGGFRTSYSAAAPSPSPAPLQAYGGEEHHYDTHTPAAAAAPPSSSISMSPLPIGGKYASIAREIQLERFRSSVGRENVGARSPSTTSVGTTLSLGGGKQHGDSNGRSLLRALTNGSGGGGGANYSHSPDAELYLRYASSSSPLAGGESVATEFQGTLAFGDTSMRGGFGDHQKGQETLQSAVVDASSSSAVLRQLALTGGVFKAAPQLGGSASPRSSNGPSTSPPLSEQP